MTAFTIQRLLSEGIVDRLDFKREPRWPKEIGFHQSELHEREMGLFEIVLIVATFFCSLVAGLVFTFAIVVMPGIKNLNDGDFIRAFQVMDRVIQNNHPLFLLVWVGSSLALIASAGFGIALLDGGNRVLLLLATFIYLFGVQLPTVAINIPLNNKLQTLDVDSMNEKDHHLAREAFESRWTRWNSIRTGFACLASVLLMIVLWWL